MATAEKELENAPLGPDDLPPDLEAYVNPEDVDASTPEVDPSYGPRIARRRATVERLLHDLDARLAAEVQALKAWRDEEARVLAGEAARLDVLLKAVLWHERQVNPRRKSIRLPYGVTVGARTARAGFKRDERVDATRALVAFAPTYTEQRPHLLWAELKAALATTDDGRVVLDGAIVPSECGIEYVPQHEVEEVKVSLEGDS